MMNFANLNSVGTFVLEMQSLFFGGIAFLDRPEPSELVVGCLKYHENCLWWTLVRFQL